MPKYRITWSARGERGDEEPLVLAAARVDHSGGEFFVFYSEDSAYAIPPTLVVRASDVREIAEVPDGD